MKRVVPFVVASLLCCSNVAFANDPAACVEEKAQAQAVWSELVTALNGKIGLQSRAQMLEAQVKDLQTKLAELQKKLPAEAPEKK